MPIIPIEQQAANITGQVRPDGREHRHFSAHPPHFNDESGVTLSYAKQVSGEDGGLVMPRKAVVRVVQLALSRGLRLPRIPALSTLYQESTVLDQIKRYKINVVFDVGANRGYYAQHLRRGGYAGHIFSFEPIAANCDFIRHLAASDNRWSVIPVALGARDEQKSFNVNTTHDGETVLSSFLTMPGSGLDLKAQDVEVQRLDSVAADLL